MRFNDLLRGAGMNKGEFARDIGMAYGSVVRWGDEIPVWARGYLVMAGRLREVEAENRVLRGLLGGKG